MKIADGCFFSINYFLRHCPTVLENRYEYSRFAYSYTNIFALNRESYAFIRESFASIRESYLFILESYLFILESYPFIRESFAFIRESYALIREILYVFLYDKETNGFTYSNDIPFNCVMFQILTTVPLTPVSTGHVRIQEPPTAARVMPAGPDKTVVKVTDSMLPCPDTSLKIKQRK